MLVLLLCLFGVVSLLMALIPVVAILPILLYIGLLIGSQAFTETPARHAPAVVLAFVPQIAAWGKTQIDGALSAAGTDAAHVGISKLGQVGVLYDGLAVLGGGAALAGIVLAATAVCIIDRQMARGACFALAGAVLSFFGLIHGEAIGVFRAPTVALGYLLVAGFLLLCARAVPVLGAAPAGQGLEPAE